MTIYTGRRVADLNLTSRDLPFDKFISLFKDPKRINLTVEEFHSLEKAEQFPHKDGAYYTNCTFDPPVRRDINSKNISVVSLDIDKPEHGLLINELFLECCLHEFNYVVYNTLSSTPEAPRWRIVVETDGNIPADYYRQAATTLAAHLNLDGLTSESFVISQAMFLAKQCSDAQYSMFFSLSGRPFTFADITDTTPTTSLTRSEGGVDDLALMTSTLDISKNDIRDALSKLNPDMSRSDWLDVAFSLRHQFGDEGFELFDEWSGGGNKYLGTDDAQKVWDSTRSTPVGKKPRTIRSLIADARDAGWDVSTIHSDIPATPYEELLEELEEATTHHQLTKTLPDKISATSLSTIHREELVSYLKKKIKDCTGSTISIAVLRKACRFRDKTDIYEGDEDFLIDGRIETPAWLEPFVYVSHTNEFYNLLNASRHTPEVFDNLFSKFLLTADDKAEGLAKPSVRPRDYAFNVVNVPTCSSYVYLPYAEQFVEFNGKKCLNTYLDMSPPSSTDRIDYVTKILQNHARVLFHTQAEADVLLDYLAYIIQNPGRKIKWTVLLQGAQGCGKTIWSEIVGAALGPGASGLVDNDLLEKEYTSWAEGKILITMEEIHVSGTNRHKVMGKLKPFITNKAVNINAKFKTEYLIPNVSNYLLLTNHKDAIAIEDSDRRFCIMHSRLQTKAQVMELQNSNHFDELYDAIENYPGTIKQFFLDRKISKDFNPTGNSPEFDGKQVTHELTKSSLRLAIDQMIADQYEMISQPVLSSAAVLRNANSEFDDFNLKVSPKQVSQTLSAMGYTKYPKRKRIEGTLHTLWVSEDIEPKHRKDAVDAYVFLQT
jgi:hypothetical protein